MPIHGAIVMTTVMMAAMISNSDADSSDPNGNSCGVCGGRHYSQCQTESCECSE